jgi:dienelactone hydrolase
MLMRNSQRLFVGLAATCGWLVPLWLGVAFWTCPVSAQDNALSARAAESILPPSGLVLEGFSARRRDAFSSDSLEAAIIRSGSLPLCPKSGQEIHLANGETLRWKSVEIDEKGGLPDGQRGQYLYVPIESDRDRIMILNAAGHSVAYFNGEPRAGDVYGYGYAHLPVILHKGVNELFLRLSSRGKPLRLALHEPLQPVYLIGADKIVPDLVVGEPISAVAAMIVVNATEETVKGLSVTTSGDGLEATTVEVPELIPMSIRKVTLRVEGPQPTEEKEQVVVNVRLHCTDTAFVESTQEMSLRVRGPENALRQTFVSEIDGSVQYYALRRAVPLSPDEPPPAIVLSCHGASVQAIRQAGSYSTKTWLHLVAPTNRRPYGFDWEDFGRADAMEVLEIAERTLPHDPSRIYLTGHSMGGHGAWHIGTTFPDRFAAIGPSAGWISYQSYGRRGDEEAEESAIEELLRRGSKAGDPLALLPNLRCLGVYILHGADDDNVPAQHARTMAEALESSHHDWYYQEEPGKGHWWSGESADGGAACLEWPEMYDMFARHALPPKDSIRKVDFVTANPGVSSRCQWLGIEGQIKHHDLSRAQIMTWANKGRFIGTTENVAVLRLDTSHMRTGGPLSVELDGQEITEIPMPDQRGSLWLGRSGDHWSVIPRPPLEHKGSHRYGAIKNELTHRFLFVYGTQGTPEASAWTLAKARFDAETFWYRGNASVDIVADREFATTAFPDRTVVLYGNADTNSAWPKLLADSPVQVRNGSVHVGDRVIGGDDLCAAFIRPRADSDVASVIAVGGSGPLGMRLCNSFSFFVPFVRYPDLLVLKTPEDSAEGASIPVAGYFGIDWSIEKGEFVWKEQ